MKPIKSKVELIKQGAGLKGVFSQIERAGRTTYNSINRIREGSAEPFVNTLKKNKHNATLEHGTIYLQTALKDVYGKYECNPYSVICSSMQGNDKFITTNYRVIIENGWEDDLQYLCEPTPHHERRYMLSFITSRAIANEFVRHRCFSFMQESTRWCNYKKELFGGQIRCVIPTAIKPNTTQYFQWEKAMEHVEHWYIELLENRVKTEVARDLLPLGLKTELIMTGTSTEWYNFFKLRCANDAHPDARYLAEKAREIIHEEEDQYDTER